jgi:hypothetical protein
MLQLKSKIGGFSALKLSKIKRLRLMREYKRLKQSDEFVKIRRKVVHCDLKIKSCAKFVENV